MKRNIHAVLLAIVITGSLQQASPAVAQELEPASPVQSVATVSNRPDFVFAVGDGSVFRSTDKGSTWEVAAEITDASSILTTTAANDGVFVILAATQSRGVLRSVDGGVNWATTDGIEGTVRAFSTREFTHRIWAGTESGIYKSDDRGATWTRSNTSPGTGFVRSIAISPTNFATAAVAIDMDGVFITTDDGGSWTPANNGLEGVQVEHLKFHRDNPAVIFASTSAGVWQSVDAGTNWLPITESFLANEVATSRASADNLFLATENAGIYRSRDGGVNWQDITPDESSMFTSVATSVDGTEWVFAGTADAGLLISSISGVEWLTVSELRDGGPTPPGTPPPPPDTTEPLLRISIDDLQNGNAVKAGRDARFRISIRNDGDGVAQNVVFDGFWVRLRLIGDNDAMSFTMTSSQGNCPDRFECYLGDLAPGETAEIEFRGSTVDGAATTYRLYADAQADNYQVTRQTFEIGSSVTIISTESGGGSADALFATLLLLLVAARRRGLLGL